MSLGFVDPAMSRIALIIEELKKGKKKRVVRAGGTCPWGDSGPIP